MSKEINCPFCGEKIQSDSEKCPKCGSWFSEPKLEGIKFGEFRIFLALQILTFGLFSAIWFFINFKAIQNLTVRKTDSLKLNWLLFLLVVTLAFYFAGDLYLTLLLGVLTLILNIAITYRVLRIIQKYTENKYGVTIEFNPYYVAFFQSLYLIHFIDTYTDRVTNVHDYYNFKSPQGIILIILMIIMAIAVNSMNSIYNLLK